MSKVKVTMECVGPRCMNKLSFRICRIKSISGRTEAASSRGKFSCVFSSLEAPFPVKYPSAKWPIANIKGHG